MAPSGSARLSAFFMLAGYATTVGAVALKSVPLLYLGFGALQGIGLGVGYITPVAKLIYLFPENKGFATGAAITGFGFSALLTGPLLEKLVREFGLAGGIALAGGTFVALMLAASFGLGGHYRRPDAETLDLRELAEEAHVPRSTFWLLWTLLFLNISVGIALLANASPLFQHTGVSADRAAWLVGVMGLANGTGRMLWATLSDKTGRWRAYAALLALTVAILGALLLGRDIWLIAGASIALMACYGGGFSLMPAYIADIYGKKHVTEIHGKVLSAWGCAGIFGPVLAGWFIHNGTAGSTAGGDNYAPAFVFLLVLAVANLGVIWRLRLRRAGSS
jgi:OFA family oxalate/formate antiporter-like MFS transporter